MSFNQFLMFLLLPFLAYFAGSIPFAFVIGKAHGVDIRTQGSKNVGATNLGRVLGKKYFWQAFLLDAAKGFFPVLIAAMLVHHLNAQRDSSPALPMWAPLLTGAASVIGHLFPVWLKFKGGKGVSTGFGAVLGFWPWYTLAGLAAGAFFVFMLLVYRYVSLASITASIVFAALVAFLGSFRAARLPYLPPTFLPWDQLAPLVAIAAAFSLMVIIRHRPNITRLLKGTEPQIGRREIEKAQMPGPR